MEKLHKDPSEFTKDSASFLAGLKQFHQSRGSPFRYPPSINCVEIDLFELYNSVTSLGGWQKVNDHQKWDIVLEKLKLPTASVNGALALRQLYIRYLSVFERIHFLGENPDDDDVDGGEGMSMGGGGSSSMSTPFRSARITAAQMALAAAAAASGGRTPGMGGALGSGGGAGGSGGAASIAMAGGILPVPMAYNHQQHNVNLQQRQAYGLSTDVASEASAYERMCMSLQSGLPNEENFVLNVCTLLSNGGRHVLQLSRAPRRLVDLLVAQAGVDAQDSSYKSCLKEAWQGCEGRRMERFWQDNLDASVAMAFGFPPLRKHMLAQKRRRRRKGGNASSSGPTSCIAAPSVDKRSNEGETAPNSNDVAERLLPSSVVSRATALSGRNRDEDTRTRRRVGGGGMFTTKRVPPSADGSPESMDVDDEDDEDVDDVMDDDDYDDDEDASRGSSSSASAASNSRLKSSRGRVVVPTTTTSRRRDVGGNSANKTPATTTTTTTSDDVTTTTATNSERGGVVSSLKVGGVSSVAVANGSDAPPPLSWEEEAALIDEDELFNLNYEVSTRSIEGQRVLRIALILHNLSFEETNIETLASSASVVRFVVLCALSRWSSLRHVALDTLANVAGHVILTPYDDHVSAALLKMTMDGITQSHDRSQVVRCLDILAHLSQCEDNEETLVCQLEVPIYQRLLELCTVHDIMLVIYALEALYALSELGQGTCERMLLVHRAIGILVGLLTLDPLSYGPQAQKGFRLVEHPDVTLSALLPPSSSSVTPNNLPHTSVATSASLSFGGSGGATSANTVMVQAPPVNIPTTWVPTTTSAISSVGVTAPGRGYAAANAAAQAATAAAQAAVNAVNAHPQMPPMTLGAGPGNTDIDTESFACSWIRSTYELCVGASVSRNDVYADYVTHSSRAGKRSVLTAAHFATCVKNMYPQVQTHATPASPRLPAMSIPPNGTMYENLRRRTVALPMQSVPVVSPSNSIIPPSVTSPLSVSTNVKTGVGGAATTGGPPNHSPILKAQLSAPLRTQTPPPQADATAAPSSSSMQTTTGSGPLSSSSSALPVTTVGGGATTSSSSLTSVVGTTPTAATSSNLIKSLLASKVSRNLQRQQRPPLVVSAVASVPPAPLDANLNPKPSLLTARLLQQQSPLLQPDNNATSASLSSSGATTVVKMEIDGANNNNNTVVSKVPTPPPTILTSSSSSLMQEGLGAVMQEQPMLRTAAAATTFVLKTEQQQQEIVPEVVAEEEVASDAVAQVAPSVDTRPANGVVTPTAEVDGAFSVAVVVKQEQQHPDGVVKTTHINGLTREIQAQLNSTENAIAVTTNGQQQQSEGNNNGDIVSTPGASPTTTTTPPRVYKSSPLLNGLLDKATPTTVTSPTSNHVAPNTIAALLNGGSDTKTVVTNGEVSPPSSVKHITVSVPNKQPQVLITTALTTPAPTTTPPPPGSTTTAVVVNRKRPLSESTEALMVANAGAPPGSKIIVVSPTDGSSGAATTTVINGGGATTTPATVTLPTGVVKSGKSRKSVVVQVPGATTGGGDSTSVTTPVAPATTPATKASNVSPARLLYYCEWKDCSQSFTTPKAVFYHAVQSHVPRVGAGIDVICGWNGCDDMKRKRWSLCTHLQDRHCNDQVLQIQAIRRQQISQFGTASLPPPQQGAPHPGYAPDAALLAIRRHALAYHNHRDASDEVESALAKSIRLTSALILRNMATHTHDARMQLRRYEPLLASIAMSKLESSRAVAQCLAEMSRPGDASNSVGAANSTASLS